MTKRLNDVGDTLTPSLKPSAESLESASSTRTKIAASTAASAANPSSLENLRVAISAADHNGLQAGSCKQSLWFSFFFDGTGNNRDADFSMSKHSNVARLFAAHRKLDTRKGVYPIYIPGVGTYFPEIGDPGGGMIGLGCGGMGEKRLAYALSEFDRFLQPHLARAQAPSNAIVEINIAIFGFSRGAALARAFVHDLLNSRLARSNSRLRLRSGGWPVRIRFMGLFDTVASVGLPMSSNTTSTVGAAASSVSYMIKSRLRDYFETRAVSLAFDRNAMPGADPAPGRFDGHGSWGGRLRIDEAVEEVRHFVAAHEIRNSFPLESVSILANGTIRKPGHFYEVVYPGAHSDVGGGYAPGEGVETLLPTESLALIPLRHMYDHALASGVPLLPATAWAKVNRDDFAVSSRLVQSYNHFIKLIGQRNTLGDAINANIASYYGWRFKSIRQKLKGSKIASSNISDQEQRFKKRLAEVDNEIAALRRKEQEARIHLDKALMDGPGALVTQDGITISDAGMPNDEQVSDARRRYADAKDALAKATARRQAVPDLSRLNEMISLYDAQLLSDVRSIQEVIKSKGLLGGNSDRSLQLRPHYKVLLHAYENEFERDQGVRDEELLYFFETYIHDSLAGFAKDATLPSDPRVVYVGGDEKLKFAQYRAPLDVASGIA